MKLAGVVVLYRPHRDVIKNIQTYIKELDILYVLDNTEQPDTQVEGWFSVFSNVKYIAFRDNKGLSYAYNYALAQTVKKYDFLLIMDQDSSFFANMMERYVKCIEVYEQENPQTVGVYCPNHDRKYDKVENQPREITYAISSGSAIPIDKARELGGFDENLFIDEVDGEFCYRMQAHGLRIIEFPSILLNHAIGHRTYCSILGKRFSTFNHSALRRYYIVRNSIYVVKKYPQYRKRYTIYLIKLFIKVLLAEKDKLKKLRYMFIGGGTRSNKSYGKIQNEII